MVAKDTLLYFPDFTNPFELNADFSDYQIGCQLSQASKVVAYWSKKLIATQQRCPILQKELLAIVEFLKVFRHMLLGQRIILHTDQKNLTYPDTKFDTDSVLRQRLKLEEFNIELKHIEGEENVAAEALSCNPIEEPDQTHPLATKRGIRSLMRDIFAQES